MGLMKLIDLTRIDKGSSYGQDKEQFEKNQSQSSSAATTTPAHDAPISNGVTNGKATKVH